MGNKRNKYSQMTRDDNDEKYWDLADTKIFTNKVRMQHGWLMIEVLAGTQIGGP